MHQIEANLPGIIPVSKERTQARHTILPNGVALVSECRHPPVKLPTRRPPYRSPFRYPGGKNWLVNYVGAWFAHFPGKPTEFVEPFAGGGSISLAVAFEKLADRVTMVELDQDVAAVWDTIINDEGGARWLGDRIAAFSLTPESIDTLLAALPSSRREQAFRTVVRNRINRGGILTSRAGRLKNGEQRADGTPRGLLSRWYPDTLKRRITAIADVRERIEFVEGDGLKTLKQRANRPDAVFFIDPPYVVGGRQLYAQYELDHEHLFELADALSGDFLITYDDDPQVRDLANKYHFEIVTVSVQTAHHKHKAELLLGRDLTWIRKQIEMLDLNRQGATI